jgi:hypothetical protein
MLVTTFSSKRTTSKVPSSPFDDDTFLFERKKVNTLEDIFSFMAHNFVLNIPLTKNTRSKRRKSDLSNHFVKKLYYIILDIDKLTTLSDMELTIKYFRDMDWECVLGESRSDYNLKGALRVDGITQVQAKSILKEINSFIPGVIDATAVNYASYQAPIGKHRVLYNGGKKIYPTPQAVSIAVQSVKVPNNIEQLCVDAFSRKGFSFVTPTNDGYQCSHPSEKKSVKGFTWNRDHPFTMSHWNRDRNVSVWEEVVSTKEYKTYQKELSIEQIKGVIPSSTPTVNMRYLNSCHEDVDNFLEHYNILRLQSPMGTAKSKVIEELIFKSRKKNLTILFLTNRKSLADDVYHKYDGLKHYLGSEIEGNKYEPGDDLVVQLDSLHKFSSKYFDIVIMDEAATTLTHLLTLEHHQTKIAKQVFSFSKKKLVLADAFLFDNMVDIFKTPKTKVLNITNGYRDDVQLQLYSQKDKFIYDLLLEAKTKSVTFSSGSTMVLKVVDKLAKEMNLKTIILSGETPDQERELIYKKMQGKKSDYDILMYSPTLTVGVSNENEIETHYHYDGGNSMNVLSSLQMVKRSRTATTIKMFLNERIRYLPVDISRIQSMLTQFSDMDEDGDSVGISDTGVKFSKLIQIQNILENRHKRGFAEIMKLQFKMNGNITKITEKVKPFMSLTTKLVKMDEKKKIHNFFEKYRELSDEQISEIEYKVYGTSKEEEYIKIFQSQMTDETLKELTKEQKEMLVQEEINTPGVINAYKMNILNPDIIKNSTNGMYTIRGFQTLKKKGIILTEMGFTKVKRKYIINDVLKELL